MLQMAYLKFYHMTIIAFFSCYVMSAYDKTHFFSPRNSSWNSELWPNQYSNWYVVSWTNYCYHNFTEKGCSLGISLFICFWEKKAN